MRMARKNQRPLWYSNICDSDTSYERNKDGNIEYVKVDGEYVPVEDGHTTEEYTKPVKFFGTIQNAGGQVEAAAYGVSVGSYHAKLLDIEGALPIKEMSLIYTIEPKKHERAQYRVIKSPIALNQTVFLLERNE